MATTQPTIFGLSFDYIIAIAAIIGAIYGLLQIIQGFINIFQTRESNKHYKRTNELTQASMGLVASSAKQTPIRAFLPAILMLGVSTLIWAALLYARGSRFDSFFVLIVILLTTIIVGFIRIRTAIREPTNASQGEKAMPEIRSPFSGTPEELIGNFSPTGNVTFKNGIYEIGERGRITTRRSFSPPIAFRLYAKTYLYELRFGYIEKEMIFNWGGADGSGQLNNEFRIGSSPLVAVKGPFDGRHVPNKGRIPVNKWVRIDVVVTRKTFKVYVEEELIFEDDADLTNFQEPFTVFQWGLSVISVKSLLVGPPIN